jgi:hypothetical protein
MSDSGWWQTRWLCTRYNSKHDVCCVLFSRKCRLHLAGMCRSPLDNFVQAGSVATRQPRHGDSPPKSSVLKKIKAIHITALLELVVCVCYSRWRMFEIVHQGSGWGRFDCLSEAQRTRSVMSSDACYCRQFIYHGDLRMGFWNDVKT